MDGRTVYAKVGTVPMLVMLDNRCNPKVGRKVRVRTTGSVWEYMMVDGINNDGVLFLSR